MSENNTCGNDNKYLIYDMKNYNVCIRHNNTKRSSKSFYMSINGVI